MSQRESFEMMLKENVYDEVTHRVFADWLSEQGLDEEAEYHYSWTKEKQEAIDWFEESAKSLGVSVEYLVKAGTDFVADGFRTSTNFQDTISDYYLDNEEKYWRNWSLVTGKPKPDEREFELSPFVCCKREIYDGYDDRYDDVYDE